MLLATISFLGVHLTPVIVFVQLLRWFNAIPIPRDIKLTIDHVITDLSLPNRLPDSSFPTPLPPLFLLGEVGVFGKYFSFLIGMYLGIYEDQHKNKDLASLGFLHECKKILITRTEFKIKMKAI